MAFFDDFTTSLKKKWLEYFQVNYGWLSLQMQVDSVKTPDGGRRPPSYLILGVLNAIEPKLAQLMFPFSKLNPDADALIEVLELNFDPDIALGNRPPGKVEPTPSARPAAAALLEDEEEEEIEELIDDGSVIIVEETVIALVPDDDAFGGMALDAMDEESSSDDDFGGMALDAMDEESSDELSVTDDDDAFGGMALDAMDEESSDDDDAFGGMALDLEDETSSQASVASLVDMEDMSLDAWGEETSSSEESIADLDDMSFEGFGEESSKDSDLDDLDAFGDMTFEELGDIDLKDEDEEKK